MKALDGHNLAGIHIERLVYCTETASPYKLAQTLQQ